MSTAVSTTTGETARLVHDWIARPQNSARTVLVTIFGDTIAPVGSSVWLAQLFKLTAPFGFSERLVRTSMFRLAADGWLTNERIGRQSRYSLTATAHDETREASRRIYHDQRPSWSGSWSLVFTDAASVDEPARDRLHEHLSWHGFVRISDHVLGSPTVTANRAEALCALAVPGVTVPVGAFSFENLDAVVASGFFDNNLALADTAASWRSFVDFLDEVERVSRVGRTEGNLDGHSAFALRTMLIQELRRIRLRTVDLPHQLLPADWPGTAAYERASLAYSQLSRIAAPWLSDVLELDYPAAVPGRFSAIGG